MFDLSLLPAILQSIVVVVVVVLAVAAWRWLRVAVDSAAASAEHNALAQMSAYARIFVLAAEQTMANQPGAVKLDWVMAQFRRILPDVDAELVRAWVEAAVSQLPPAPPPKTLTLAAPADCESLAPPAPSHASPAPSSRRSDAGRCRAGEAAPWSRTRSIRDRCGCSGSCSRQSCAT